MSSISLSDFEKIYDFSLDMNSVQKVLGNAKDVVVYGFRYAYYKVVTDRLKYPDAHLTNVFTYSIGNLELEFPGEPQERMLYHTKDIGDGELDCARVAKAGIINLALENYKREKVGKELMPLLFCIGSNTNPEFTTTPQSLADKTAKSLITHKELRRVFKVCTYFEASDDPEMRKLADIAKRTLKMVTVDKTPSGQYTLNEVEPVWNDSQWTAEWTKRMQSHPPGYEKLVLHQKWYKELHERVQKIHTLWGRLKLWFTCR